MQKKKNTQLLREEGEGCVWDIALAHPFPHQSTEAGGDKTIKTNKYDRTLIKRLQ